MLSSLNFLTSCYVWEISRVYSSHVGDMSSWTKTYMFTHRQRNLVLSKLPNLGIRWFAKFWKANSFRRVAVGYWFSIHSKFNLLLASLQELNHAHFAHLILIPFAEKDPYQDQKKTIFLPQDCASALALNLWCCGSKEEYLTTRKTRRPPGIGGGNRTIMYSILKGILWRRLCAFCWHYVLHHNNPNHFFLHLFLHAHAFVFRRVTHGNTSLPRWWISGQCFK